MSVSSVPVEVRLRLWGKAAGRCEYAGCNQPLWRDNLTQVEFNTSYIAHIVADQPDGPRGDKVLSKLLAKELSNLMLLCDEHHRLVDKADIEGHPVELLHRMKADHEARIELITNLQSDKRSEVLLYGANVGEHASPVSMKRCCPAMLPRYYPATGNGISLGIKNSAIRDYDAEFWKMESTHLRRQFAERVAPGLADGSISHISVFTLAPQPLLILLGHLLSDIPACEVYQKHREPDTWEWQSPPNPPGFTVEEPKSADGIPVLVVSISATVTDERIVATLGENVSIWRISVEKPSTSFITAQSQLEEFRQVTRAILNRVKAAHGEHSVIHVFPILPVATAVELGRVHMPKADLPYRIYDQSSKLGGFVHALDVGDFSRVKEVKS